MLQIESFIPFWEWDYPKKKKSRKERGTAAPSEKGKGKESTGSGADSPPTAAFIEEIETSGESRPTSRAARVEDAPDED